MSRGVRSSGGGHGEGLGWAEEALEILAGVDLVVFVDDADVVADAVDGEAGFGRSEERRVG